MCSCGLLLTADGVFSCLEGVDLYLGENTRPKVSLQSLWSANFLAWGFPTVYIWTPHPCERGLMVTNSAGHFLLRIRKIGVLVISQIFPLPPPTLKVALFGGPCLCGGCSSNPPSLLSPVLREYYNSVPSPAARAHPSHSGASPPFPTPADCPYVLALTGVFAIFCLAFRDDY